MQRPLNPRAWNPLWFISTPDCILCALESRFDELRKLGAPDELYINVGSRIMELSRRGRAVMFIESHNHIRISLNIDDLHSTEKLELERAGKELARELRAVLGDDVINYVKAAAAANSVDIRMRGYEFNTEDLRRGILEEPAWIGLGREDLLGMIQGSKSLGYLVDNSGEFQIDKLLIEKLMNMGIKVSVYAKSTPYEVDVTHNHVRSELGGNVTVKAIPGNYSAFWYRELRNELGGYDLVISKGLDNLETYAEVMPGLDNVIFLFRAKCPIIAKLLNVAHNKPVIMNTKPINKLRKEHK
ncbi:ARMT1-like domain-containing protein [Vulcanisaeta thermophila]|uniref:ARMT1-like domain-containing protein n=1 Tax=Vulcanisaeta thermophila TaxID=867917 RepID=UPI001EE2CE31|nr:ARMT1-like domain-containing protein [Vulcanisaeta thermophila]